jgi:hypothetical protein
MDVGCRQLWIIVTTFQAQSNHGSSWRTRGRAERCAALKGKPNARVRMCVLELLQDDDVGIRLAQHLSATMIVS